MRGLAFCKRSNKKLRAERRRYSQNWNGCEALNTRENFKLNVNNKYAILGEWDEEAAELMVLVATYVALEKKIVLIDERPLEKK